jgi:hypothetical protein
VTRGSESCPSAGTTVKQARATKTATNGAGGM